jgi:uncharacterized protein YukE
MPFNTEQLAYAGKAAIDYFLKNDPIDQINVERPLIKKLTASMKPYAGGLQYVVEQLRKSNDSNFQSYFGDSQVSYNRKRTLDQAKFSWGAFHDGFGLNEDELAQNGITMTDEKNSVPSDAEKVQLTNLLSENMETLKLGFQENFDLMLHRDGTGSATDIAGLDLLVSTAPTSSVVVGTINQSTNVWWQNYADIDISLATPGNLVDRMEIAWRETTRFGGYQPDFILAGSDFIDAYRRDAGLTVNRRFAAPAKGGATLDAATSGIFFKNVEIVWDPVFDTLDATDAPAIEWSKRCYFLNTRFLNLRPIKGHWMVSRKPPRVYDRYVHYWALTSKAALTTGKRNAHAVLSIY